MVEDGLELHRRRGAVAEPQLRQAAKHRHEAEGVRARLAPPFSVELEAANTDLVAIESEIDTAVGRGEEQAALNLLRMYFMSVSTVFRNVDTNLKDFCMRLSEVNQSLKTVLDMC